MDFNRQAILSNDRIQLLPLVAADFEALYEVAADPDVWAQHPNKDRWQEAVFRTFFAGAMQSQGAFKVLEKETQKLLGSSRFYDYEPADNSVFIGYTFYGKDTWGTGVNHIVKRLMLDYYFKYVSQVYFHIGASNLRSQVAIERLGAEKIAEETVAYVGEANRLNFRYRILKENWLNSQK